MGKKNKSRYGYDILVLRVYRNYFLVFYLNLSKVFILLFNDDLVEWNFMVDINVEKNFWESF